MDSEGQAQARLTTLHTCDCGEELKAGLPAAGSWKACWERGPSTGVGPGIWGGLRPPLLITVSGCARLFI